MPLVLTGDGAVGPLSASEVGFLDGVTSSVQTQLNGKAAVASQGLTLITTQSFSAASAVNVNNCFSATYDNYRIVMYCTFGTASSHTLRLRASGSDDSGTNYRINGHQSQATAFNLNEQSLTHFYFSSAANNLNQHLVVDISRPALAAPTGYSAIGASWDATSGNRTAYIGGLHISSTAYDGFTISASQNATGSLRVYGYGN